MDKTAYPHPHERAATMDWKAQGHKGLPGLYEIEFHERTGHFPPFPPEPDPNCQRVPGHEGFRNGCGCVGRAVVPAGALNALLGRLHEAHLLLSQEDREDDLAAELLMIESDLLSWKED